jgi:hypothetical protein
LVRAPSTPFNKNSDSVRASFAARIAFIATIYWDMVRIIRRGVVGCSLVYFHTFTNCFLGSYSYLIFEIPSPSLSRYLWIIIASFHRRALLQAVCPYITVVIVYASDPTVPDSVEWYRIARGCAMTGLRFYTQWSKNRHMSWEETP